MSNISHAVADKVEITGVISNTEKITENGNVRYHITLDAGAAQYTLCVSTWDRTHRGFSKELGYMAGNTLEVKAVISKTTYFHDGSTPVFDLVKVSLRRFTLGAEAIRKRAEIIAQRAASPCMAHLTADLENARYEASTRGFSALKSLQDPKASITSTVVKDAFTAVAENYEYERTICPEHGMSMDYPITTPAK